MIWKYLILTYCEPSLLIQFLGLKYKHLSCSYVSRIHNTLVTLMGLEVITILALCNAITYWSQKDGSDKITPVGWPMSERGIRSIQFCYNYIYIAFDVQFSAVNIVSCLRKIIKKIMCWLLKTWSWTDHHSARSWELSANHTLQCMKKKSALTTLCHVVGSESNCGTIFKNL